MRNFHTSSAFLACSLALSASFFLSVIGEIHFSIGFAVFFAIYAVSFPLCIIADFLQEFSNALAKHNKNKEG